jgi:hypothetical protein
MAASGIGYPQALVVETRRPHLPVKLFGIHVNLENPHLAFVPQVRRIDIECTISQAQIAFHCVSQSEAHSTIG